MKISTLAAVVAGLEILAALYLSWITFLFAFWFVDDGIAFTMTNADWRRVGVERFLQGAVTATRVRPPVLARHRSASIASPAASRGGVRESSPSWRCSVCSVAAAGKRPAHRTQRTEPSSPSSVNAARLPTASAP